MIYKNIYLKYIFKTLQRKIIIKFLFTSRKNKKWLKNLLALICATSFLLRKNEILHQVFYI